MTHAASFDVSPESCSRTLLDQVPDWLHPVSNDVPCGPSLEYDAEYAVLQSRMLPRGVAQYGDFVGMPEAPNWAEVERDCRRLLLRTWDVNLLVWLCRARTRLAQATGLAQSLVALAEALRTWPDEIHPQLIVEGERDPAVRANALAALADPEGLLGDVRDILVTANAARYLTVREVERAWAVPRAHDALSPEAAAQQLSDLHRSSAGDALAPVRQLAAASRAARRIAAWAAANMGPDAPSLQPLLHLLRMFEPAEVPACVQAREPAASDAGSSRRPAPAASGAFDAGAGWRESVRGSVRSAREWLEVHEPSSPAAVLLKQAERMIGERFCDVADMVPLDLLRKWDAGSERT
ncbi:MAG: type VI secretion system ImpA family N-terminal domain-containing protein [Luteibacter sp.]|uniref:type VI secretion system protein TssA n=1 Tax=Luteibacter sp. TaxID=1886636 RepID=UPI0028096A14|nr:type VI secretion system ImpA family N-terminal domain-containing protein [Luteibacter sp.]MDQ7998134.1 type VI secretion system ImpA family N-terminal domain-containing protein [Luteibacter sp.]